MAEQRFTAELHDSGRGGGRWLQVPFDPSEVFGEARAPVAGTLNGTSFRGRLSVYGGKTYLGLNKEIRDAAAKAAFDKLAFTHRKEYARWIAEAKKEETRERRVAKALEMLKTGERLS